jgi:two-component system copper resistance phosphate regulon response regulator CusR
MRLLIVEDNQDLRDSLRSGLGALGFTADAAADGEEGWQRASSAEHDLIILDRMLPRLDGLDVLRRLRQSGSRVPVLMLTARDAIDERVAGLEAGADDYLVKPFAVSELVARVRALLRRGHLRAEPVLRVGELEIDTAGRIARRGGRRIDLTPKEFAALECLALRAGAVVDRSELYAHVAGAPGEAASNVVDALIARLRRKLEPPGATPVVMTRRGFGYQLVVDG